MTANLMDDQDTTLSDEWVRSVYSAERLDKGTIHIRGGKAWDCITLPRKAGDLKSYELFTSGIFPLFFF